MRRKTTPGADRFARVAAGKPSRPPSWRVAAIGAAAAVILAVMAIAALTGGGRPPAPAASPAASPPMSPAAASTSSAPAGQIPGPIPPPESLALTLGKTSAPVTIVEFGDYQCTSCGAFARDTQAALIREYVDAGVVRLEWRDFPWVNDQSVSAAIAARAAGRQGKFWAFHDYLFAHQFASEGSGQLSAAFLLATARKLGLDVGKFLADARDPALRRAVQADNDFGQGLGVPGTPAFLIGGKPFFGAQPLPAFEAAIAAARRG